MATSSEMQTYHTSIAEVFPGGYYDAERGEVGTVSTPNGDIELVSGTTVAELRGQPDDTWSGSLAYQSASGGAHNAGTLLAPIQSMPMADAVGELNSHYADYLDPTHKPSVPNLEGGDYFEEWGTLYGYATQGWWQDLNNILLDANRECIFRRYELTVFKWILVMKRSGGMAIMQALPVSAQFEFVVKSCRIRPNGKWKSKLIRIEFGYQKYDKNAKAKGQVKLGGKQIEIDENFSYMDPLGYEWVKKTVDIDIPQGGLDVEGIFTLLGGNLKKPGPGSDTGKIPAEPVDPEMGTHNKRKTSID